MGLSQRSVSCKQDSLGQEPQMSWPGWLPGISAGIFQEGAKEREKKLPEDIYSTDKQSCKTNEQIPCSDKST